MGYLCDFGPGNSLCSRMHGLETARTVALKRPENLKASTRDFLASNGEIVDLCRYVSKMAVPLPPSPNAAVDASRSVGSARPL